MQIGAIIGGPCSGKSSCFKALEGLGKVFVAPETASVLMGGGVMKGLPILGQDIEVTPEVIRIFQQAVAPTQIASELLWQQAARDHGKRLVVCDRGLADLAAYLPGGVEEMEQLVGMNREQIYTRYDFIVVLRSLAVIDAAAYEREKASNSCRRETLEEAIALEEATQQAWADHPNRIEIDCTRGIGAITDQVTALVKELTSREIERKFLLKAMPTLPDSARPIVLEQVQCYLPVRPERGEARLRQTTYPDGAKNLTLTCKGDGTLERFEWETTVAPEAFELLWDEFEGLVVEKTRTVFRHLGQVFEIDRYQLPRELIVLEVEFGSRRDAESFRLPSWCNQALEVTEDPSYKAKNLARRAKLYA